MMSRCRVEPRIDATEQHVQSRSTHVGYAFACGRDQVGLARSVVSRHTHHPAMPRIWTRICLPLERNYHPRLLA